MEQLFSEVVPSYKTVFGHYRKWCKEGAWEVCWVEILKKNKSKIDCSSCDFDGSQTPAKKGGEQVGYQARKKAKPIFVKTKEKVEMSSLLNLEISKENFIYPKGFDINKYYEHCFWNHHSHAFSVAFLSVSTMIFVGSFSSFGIDFLV